MTVTEAQKLMAMIKANYPMYHAKTDEVTQKMAVKIMAKVLSDLCPEDCEMALLQYISEPHEFPPNAGQIRQIALNLRSPFANSLIRNMIPSVRSYHEKIEKGYQDDSYTRFLLTDTSLEDAFSDD